MLVYGELINSTTKPPGLNYIMYFRGLYKALCGDKAFFSKRNYYSGGPREDHRLILCITPKELAAPRGKPGQPVNEHPRREMFK